VFVNSVLRRKFGPETDRQTDRRRRRRRNRWSAGNRMRRPRHLTHITETRNA
jgi:hypothetical protein